MPLLSLQGRLCRTPRNTAYAESRAHSAFFVVQLADLLRLVNNGQAMFSGNAAKLLEELDAYVMNCCSMTVQQSAQLESGKRQAPFSMLVS
jgi:hypothetical protein